MKVELYIYQSDMSCLDGIVCKLCNIYNVIDWVYMISVDMPSLRIYFEPEKVHFLETTSYPW